MAITETRPADQPTTVDGGPRAFVGLADHDPGWLRRLHRHRRPQGARPPTRRVACSSASARLVLVALFHADAGVDFLPKDSVDQVFTLGPGRCSSSSSPSRCFLGLATYVVPLQVGPAPWPSPGPRPLAFWGWLVGLGHAHRRLRHQRRARRRTASRPSTSFYVALALVIARPAARLGVRGHHRDRPAHPGPVADPDPAVLVVDAGGRQPVAAHPAGRCWPTSCWSTSTTTTARPPPSVGRPVAHLAWVFGQPQLYVVAIPVLGVISDVIATLSRRCASRNRGVMMRRHRRLRHPQLRCLRPAVLQPGGVEPGPVRRHGAAHPAAGAGRAAAAGPPPCGRASRRAPRLPSSPPSAWLCCCCRPWPGPCTSSSRWSCTTPLFATPAVLYGLVGLGRRPLAAVAGLVYWAPKIFGGASPTGLARLAALVGLLGRPGGRRSRVRSSASPSASPGSTTRPSS